MSKPAGRCVFCGERKKLTHGHIWPEWIGESMPFEDKQHIQIIGHTYTFTPRMKTPRAQRIVKQGHGTSRKPRNTCRDCNGGWMSRIEGAAKPVALSLMQGRPILLGIAEQMLLASLLCLITVRNEFSALAAIAVPAEERAWLRTQLTPPWKNWKIWIARYVGARLNEHWVLHYPMHIDSEPGAETGPHKTNTQTTTLVIGQLCAHVFSSTIIGEDFPGYEGINLCQIWPPSQFGIEWRSVPAYGEPALFALAEALGREMPAGDA